MEVDKIIENPEAPDFANTVEALERKGRRLENIAAILFNLNHAETSGELEEIASEATARLTEFSNDLTLNPQLFERVKTVYDYYHGRLWEASPLAPDQWMLLDNTYKGFTRSGAGLNEADKEKYRTITSELSQLTLRFGRNVLAETNAFSIRLTDPADLEGLPAHVVEAMAGEAKEQGVEGWVVTLKAPSYIPFMTYSPRREIKRELWMRYNSRGFGGGEHDNREAVKRIAELRLQLANLLGYVTFADYVLEERMAGTSKRVETFLHDLLAETRQWGVRDFEMIRDYARMDDGDFMSWDWAYYEEKYRNERYALSDEAIKPYLKLENVLKGIFLLAEKLYGLTFRENKAIPLYHPDVKAYEVHDESGKFMAALYLDFFPRKGKQGGAWMTSYREMYAGPEGEVRPLVSLCCNFTKPTASAPSLLTFNELETLLHEFGHALHGMLSEGRYASLTGTNVYRDFVELPSQIMENWATEKEFLDLWAVHYKTGEAIPAELVERIVAAKNYLAAYRHLRQVSFGLNDMAWHSITAPVEESVDIFERRAMEKAQFFPHIPGTCFSTGFSHIFSGGYAAGYYSYKWAEVLEADAFALFRERGIFNREVAGSFRRNILSRGGSEHPMSLYMSFRGHEPDPRALFDKMGIPH